MTETKQIHHAARRSLASVVAAAAAITANHLFSLGPRALALGLGITAAAVALLLWFRRGRSPVALAAYLALNLWVVVGFGLWKGLWKGALPLFVGSALAAASPTFPQPAIGPFLVEASALLMFVAALVVAWNALALARAWRAWRAGVALESPTQSQRRVTIVGVAGAAAAMLGAFVLADRDTFRPPPDGVVTIGVVAPVTGPYAVLGTSFVRAVEMARDDLKGTRYTYRLLIEDSGPDPARARDVVRSVVARSDAVIGAVSLIGQVTKPYATRARIPHLCVCTVTPIGDGGYNFTNIPTPAAEGKRWVEEARRRGVRTVAIVSQNYPSIVNHVKALKQAAARGGVSVVYDETFADTVTDFRPTIGRARATTPDVYYVEALEPTLDRLGEQLRTAGIRNLSSVVAPSVSVRPELFEGTWYTDSDLADTTFRQRFEAKYPGVQFATHMMPYAYDSFDMIVRAYERGVNPAVYVRALERYDGAAGTVTKPRGSGNFESEPTVWVIRNGRPTKVDTSNERQQVARRAP